MDIPTSAPTSLDSVEEQKILREFLDTISNSGDDDCSLSVCANCKRQPKKGQDLKRCSSCQFTRYCSVECQRKDWDFRRFAYSAVDKGPGAKDV